MSLSPPRSTLEDFKAGVKVGIQHFRHERLSEDPEDYQSHFFDARAEVEELLELTTDLTQLGTSGREAVLKHLHALRYMAAPPISEDDLCTVADVQKRYLLSPNNWHTVVSTIMAVADRQRLPWLGAGREATDAERETATVATAAQLAASRMGTQRRNESRKMQEEVVAQSLKDTGFVQVDAHNINTSRDFPDPGTYMRESSIKGSKADLVVGLYDNRILGIECKVSNSAVNSHKRVNREAATKAVRWTADFGTAQIVPAAVIAGVYNPDNLLKAQTEGLTIWWSHDIDQMTDWVKRAR